MPSTSASIGSVALAMVLIAAPAARGQQPAAAEVEAPAIPAVEPVFQHIPAGVFAFVAIRNVEGLTGKIDEYIDEIGLTEQVSQAMPSGALDALRGAMMLGEGFAPSGGFAAVMLDPEAFGIDLRRMFPKAGSGATQPTPPSQLPFVLLVPGASVEQVFPQFETSPAGQYTSIVLPMGPMLAGQKGGYVALSPMAEALDAFLESGPDFTTQVGARVVGSLTAADLGVYVNMRQAGPVIADAMEASIQMSPSQPGPGATTGPQPFGPFGPGGGFAAAIMPMYRDMLADLRDFVFTLRIGDTGVVLDQLATFDPESEYGQMYSVYEDAPPVDLGRLPNLPYVIAGGGTTAADADLGKARQLSLNMIEQLLSQLNIDEETRGRSRRLCMDLSEQFTGAQFVLGGAPEGAGVFGAAYILRCKDPERTRALVRESTDLAQRVLRSIVGEQASEFELTYEPGVASLEGASVDAIRVHHPELETMTDEDREELKRFLGEADVRALVTAADPQTLVVTFGGAEPFLAETLRAVRSGGTIPDAPGTAEAMRHMPAGCYSVTLFNVANLLQVVRGAAEAMGQAESIPPLEIDCPTPIAYGAAAEDNCMMQSLYVPTPLVKQGAASVMGLMAPPPPQAWEQGQTAPAPSQP